MSGEEKNIYRQAREAAGLSREEASEKLGIMSVDRIGRIENEVYPPYPNEALMMAKVYREPSLCNYYCAQECPIGQQYVPEIKLKALSQIVLEVLSSLHAMERNTAKFVDIAVDGNISDDELADFVEIQRNLERISVTVETLQLWSEQMLATGKINTKKYKALTKK